MANKEKALKKEGQDPNKKRRRMRAAVAVRKEAAAGRDDETQRDEVDKIKFKRGSAGDRTVRQ